MKNTRDQNFTLDHPGNWTHTDYDLNADNIYTGVGEYDWDFTHNKANEITQWDNQTDQVVPVYDAAGNMTDDKRDYQYVYDAFYRLVTVKNQSGTVKAEYKYNGLGHGRLGCGQRSHRQDACATHEPSRVTRIAQWRGFILHRRACRHQLWL